MARFPAWILPLIASTVWIALLITFLAWWAAQGKPVFPTEEGNIPYISDVAVELPSVMISMCAITGGFFVLTLIAERWLRHAGRLHANLRRRERVCASLAVFWAAAGTAGLILLAVFNTANYHEDHDIFLLVFMAGVVLSAISTISEYWWLRRDYAHVTRLRRSYIIKAVIIICALGTAIGFAVTLFTSKQNTAAALEWATAGLFWLYLLSFVYDLWPVKASNGSRRSASEEEKEIDFQRRNHAQF